MATVCLDSQIFYVPPAAAGPELASRGFRAREGDPSAAIFGVPLHPPLPQDVHDPQSGDAGKSQADAILIPSDDEFDDLDSRSDTSFKSLGGLLLDARNKVKSGSVTGTGKSVDTALDDNDRLEQDHLIPASPASPVCAGWSCRQGDGCPKHPNLSAFFRRRRNAKLPNAKAGNEGSEGDKAEPADAGLPPQPPSSQDQINFQRDVGGQCNTDLEADHRPTRPAVPPQVVESRARTPTLSDDESTSELEPVDAEPCLQPQSRCGTASSCGVDPQQKSGSCHLSQHRGHRDDSDRKVSESDWPKPAADPHRRSQSPYSAASTPRVETQQWSDPSVQDDRGEQNEGFVAPPQAQESRASMPRSPVEGSNAPELAHTKPSMQPSASPDQANLQHDIGRHQHCGPSDRGDCGPVADSVVEHGQDDDVAQPPRKRRGIRTSSPTTCRTTPEPQTRLHRTGQAQRRTNQRPKSRRSQCPSDVPEDQGQQREGSSIAPPRAQEVQPPASQVGVKRQRDLGRHRHCGTDDGEDYCPSVCSDTEHSEDDAVRPPRRKRRRASAATHTAGGTAPQQQTRPYRGDSSREARRPSRRPRRQHGATHPSSSREPTLERDAETDRTHVATFEEWPLGNAVLKRVTMNGSPPTFMLQFTWGPCAEHGAGHRGTENRGTVSSAKRRRPARQKSKGSTKDEDKPTSTSSRARYTLEDDAKIRQLKEQGLSWIAIAKHFPGRSAGAIEVRYYTKLKTADPSRGREEEWEVEEICGYRGPDDGGPKLLVRWEGGEETWEPYENMAETKALDEYERLHGRVIVDTVDAL